MVMYLVTVKYVGSPKDIMVDYNGKRYCFSKKIPVKEIPVEVYNYVLSTNHMYKDSLIPITQNDTRKVEALEKRIKELEAEIERLKGQKEEAETDQKKEVVQGRIKMLNLFKTIFLSKRRWALG
jgi:hypothetical protein